MPKFELQTHGYGSLTTRKSTNQIMKKKTMLCIYLDQNFQGRNKSNFKDLPKQV